MEKVYRKMCTIVSKRATLRFRLSLSLLLHHGPIDLRLGTKSDVIRTSVCVRLYVRHFAVESSRH